MYNDSCLIDKILPAAAFHIVAGPPSSGKTTWLMQTLAEFSQGLPVLGQRCYPVPYAYISLGRPSGDAAVSRRLATNESGAITGPLIGPLIDGSLYPHFKTVKDYLDLEQVRDKRLVIFDGLLLLFPSQSNVNNASDVFRFCVAIDKLCRDRNVTIIGVLLTTKDQENQMVRSPIERINGSSFWTSGVHTKFIFTYREPGRISKGVSLFVHPGNAVPFTMHYDFAVNGRLVESGEQLVSLDPDFETMSADVFFDKQTLTRTTTPFDLQELIALSATFRPKKGPFSKRTVERWALDAARHGTLVQVASKPRLKWVRKG